MHETGEVMNPSELDWYERKTLRAERMEILLMLLHCRSLQEAITWLIVRLNG